MVPFSSTQKLFPFKGSIHRTAAFSPETSPVLKVREKKYKTMEEILAKAKYAVVEKEDYSNINCEECGLGEFEWELLLCDKCDKGFHMRCVRPVVVRVPIGSWLCPSCSGQPRVRSLSQKKIIDFFKIQKCKGINIEFNPPSQDSKKRRRRSTAVCYKKKRRRLLPYFPTEDPARRLEQMRSLATALTALKMEFINELMYLPGMAPRSANQAEFEDGGMQVLSKEDLETVEHCRAMFRRGECPPLLVVYDLCEGYTVQADAPIKDMTFIAEYTGDVDYIKNREKDDCDSLMTLLLATDPSNSLVICPDKRGNIARFINGINNHTPESRKKQNLKCVRYNVNGECCVFLVATRDIAKGERLYYDYNGYEHEYPTHHFV
ncbi:probable Histone-lysine N-methyltransferase ATXR5 [Amaranthus tricolor]|uniref:probable Histone-lysine N-methyltransferase ATXR5 n=1 Tax=Amaranthus tricolor TaxID=29722 RepID=UPI00258FEE58|nr:probable Histone-lysine N-methyltransferase ATXR5 [Amaranthus tricolor]